MNSWVGSDGVLHEGKCLGSKDEFQVIDCEACGFKHVIPIPTEDFLKTYYQDHWVENRPAEFYEKVESDFEWQKKFYDEKYDVFDRHCQGDKKRISTTLNNIGLIYNNLCNYEKALEFYLKSLFIRKKLANKKGMADSFSNIGTIYHSQGNYEKALEYYSKSLEISEKIGDKYGIGDSYNNIGLISNEQGNYEKALDYLIKSKNIFQFQIFLFYPHTIGKGSLDLQSKLLR